MRPTIGIAIICKNEEALLSRCLESVKEADQIVVCDTGSTDRTIEIARRYTNEVYLDFIWCDDFAKARNHAKSKIKTDWVLSIDADEYLHDFSEVRRAIELAKTDYIACTMIAEGGQRLEFKFSRLFKNTPEIFWVQPIHVHLNVGGEGEHVGNIKITFGWSPAHNLDPDRALRILEKAVADEGNQAGRNLYYLGREYWYKQKYKQAAETLWRYVEISRWDAEKAEAFLIMSQSYSAMHMDDEARNAVLQAIKINPNFKEAIEWMAGICPPEKAMQWKRMARTANNHDVLWDRSPAKPTHDVIFLAPHNDDEVLFGAYTLIRLKPLVIIVTDSYIQPLRGDIGCTAEIRRKETIEAMKILGCPVLFMGIPDNELNEINLSARLKHFNPEAIYVPAIQGGNLHHDIVGKVGMDLFGRLCERYTTYTKTELYTTGGWEIQPTPLEIELKNRALDCYVSQINLPSTRPHFEAVRNRSEWLV